MKKFFIYFPIIFFATILQVSAIPVIFRGWLPDLVLSMVLAWALIDGFEKFFFWAVFSGILYDLLAFSNVGISVIVFSLATYAVSFFSRRFSTEMRGVGSFLSIFFVFSATIGAKAISSFAWLEKGFAEKGPWKGLMFFGEGLAGAFIWNLVFFFAFFYFLNRLEDRFLLRQKSTIIVK